MDRLSGVAAFEQCKYALELTIVCFVLPSHSLATSSFLFPCVTCPYTSRSFVLKSLISSSNI